MYQGLPWWSSSKGSVSTAGGTGSIPGQGTNIPHTMWCGQKKKKGSSYTMPIKLYNSIVFFFFSIFTELFNHHHNQFQNILHLSKRNLIPISDHFPFTTSFQSFATTNLPSVSIDTCCSFRLPSFT